jgi:hypothetical protein
MDLVEARIPIDDEDDEDDENSTEVIFQREPEKMMIPSTPTIEWDDEAIINCFHVSMKSHDAGDGCFVDWKPPASQLCHADWSPLCNWKPSPLELPAWMFQQRPELQGRVELLPDDSTSTQQESPVNLIRSEATEDVLSFIGPRSFDPGATESAPN